MIANSRRLAQMVVVLLLLLPMGSALAQTRRAERPTTNVLFILSDDQRPDTIGALGNRQVRTPNLDGLVRAGSTFTRAVSPNPLCVPSRAEILSGCSGFRNGVLPPYRNRLDPN